MTIYRLSGEALLRLVSMAAAAPGVDVDTVLAIVHGADVEESEPDPGLPDVSDGPDVDAGKDAAPLKPAKPE